jgi:hypothetical protein
MIYFGRFLLAVLLVSFVVGITFLFVAGKNVFQYKVSDIATIVNKLNKRGQHTFQAQRTVTLSRTDIPETIIITSEAKYKTEEEAKGHVFNPVTLNSVWFLSETSDFTDDGFGDRENTYNETSQRNPSYIIASKVLFLVDGVITFLFLLYVLYLVLFQNITFSYAIWELMDMLFYSESEE